MRVGGANRRWLLVAPIGMAAACGLEITGSPEAPPNLEPIDGSVLGDQAERPPTDATLEALVPQAQPDGTAILDDDGGLDGAAVVGPGGGATIIIRGGKYHINDQEDAGACSINSREPTGTLDVFNRTDAGIQILWVDYHCGESPYGVLAPAQDVALGSYVTHRWRLRRNDDRLLLVDFTLGQKDKSYDVIVLP